jgi:uncharacterized protein (TIGR03435 family)
MKAPILFMALAAAAVAQTRPAFEVATIKPAAQLDMAKMAAEIQAGHMPRMGAHIDNGRAEYTYVAMRELVALAYSVKPYQITGPDWMANQRFDIVAKMPEGSKKEDAPAMLQSLLEERFKLKIHKTSAEHPVLGLVVGKGGPKLKESAEAPKPIDPDTPLREGEMSTESPDGQVRILVGKGGSATVNMGAKGMMQYSVNPATQTFHLDGRMITMAGFADMLTRFSTMGGSGGKQVVDMTGLPGVYEVAIDFALADLLQMARAAGMNIPMGAGGGPAGAGAGPADAASDPGGTASSIVTAVQALGLKLESRKAMIEQLIVDSVEKTPTEN